MDTSPAELKAHYATHGYVIVRGLVTPSEHADLLSATERAVTRTRSGSWTHARVVGKQFPPYGAGDDVWGVQHAMHPLLGEPAFARWYAGDAVRGAAKMLLECQDDHLQMGRLRTSGLIKNRDIHQFVVVVVVVVVGAQNCSMFSCTRSAQTLHCAGIVMISGIWPTRTKSARRSKCGTTGYVTSS